MEQVVSMVVVGFLLAALFALAYKCETDYQEHDK
jgi:hypothetical protein